MWHFEHREADWCFRCGEAGNGVCLPVHAVVLIELSEAVEDAEESVASEEDVQSNIDCVSGYLHYWMN